MLLPGGFSPIGNPLVKNAKVEWEEDGKFKDNDGQ